MNFTQGFVDGYENNDFDYDFLEIDKKYLNDYHNGKKYRNIHRSIFELQDEYFDIEIVNFKSNHEAAIILMNNFTFD